jgi:hypothetical protein
MIDNFNFNTMPNINRYWINSVKINRQNIHIQVKQG